MEKRKFEDSFKDAFKDAEVGPSENVWTNIELELEKESGEKTRRTLFFYKLLAAASITFALTVTGIGVYLNDKSNRQLKELAARNTTPNQTQADKTNEATEATKTPTQVAEQRSNTEATNADNNVVSKGVKPNDTKQLPVEKLDADHAIALQKNDATSEVDNATGAKAPANASIATRSTRSTTVTSKPDAVAAYNISSGNNNGETTDTKNNVHQIYSAYINRSLPKLYEPGRPSLSIAKPEADPVSLMLARLADEERALAMETKDEQRKKESRSEQIWTSLGFAAGGFNSVNHSVAAPAPAMGFASANSSYAQYTSVPDKQAKASGTAYSLGLSVGTKLSKRWVLQGGVNYMTQSSDYVATNVVADNNYESLKAESLNTLEKLPLLADVTSDKKLAPTAPYTVNNNVKFFSLPVQAGYLVVNRKFGVQLNAGLSSDFFLQNTITPQSGSLDKTTQGSGDDSPYRTVNFSGLMGTEFSYRLGQHYRIALNPGLRYPLNSVYKSDVGIRSTPVTFDVGLRFRYIFQ